MDKFKDFIDQHREKMDVETPPVHMLSSIITHIEHQKTLKYPHNGTKINKLWVLAIAACLILGAFVFWIAFKHKPSDARPDVVVQSLPVTKQEILPEIKVPVESINPARFNHTSMGKTIRQINKRIVPNFNKNQFYILANDANSSVNRYNAMKLPAQVQKIDKEILDALIYTLNTDPSTNVRLAALESLSMFISESYVKKSLIASLKTQTDPLIQINLIQILSAARLEAIEVELNRMYESDDTDIFIKHEILAAKQKVTL